MPSDTNAYALLTSSQIRKVKAATSMFRLILMACLVNQEEQVAEDKYYTQREKTPKGQRLEPGDQGQCNHNDFFILNESWMRSTIEEVLANMNVEQQKQGREPKHVVRG